MKSLLSVFVALLISTPIIAQTDTITITESGSEHIPGGPTGPYDEIQILCDLDIDAGEEYQLSVREEVHLETKGGLHVYYYVQFEMVGNANLHNDGGDGAGPMADTTYHVFTYGDAGTKVLFKGDPYTWGRGFRTDHHDDDGAHPWVDGEYRFEYILWKKVLGSWTEVDTKELEIDHPEES